MGDADHQERERHGDDEAKGARATRQDSGERGGGACDGLTRFGVPAEAGAQADDRRVDEDVGEDEDDHADGGDHAELAEGAEVGDGQAGEGERGDDRRDERGAAGVGEGLAHGGLARPSFGAQARIAAIEVDAVFGAETAEDGAEEGCQKVHLAIGDGHEAVGPQEAGGGRREHERDAHQAAEVERQIEDHQQQGDGAGPGHVGGDLRLLVDLLLVGAGGGDCEPRVGREVLRRHEVLDAADDLFGVVEVDRGAGRLGEQGDNARARVEVVALAVTRQAVVGAAGVFGRDVAKVDRGRRFVVEPDEHRVFHPPLVALAFLEAALHLRQVFGRQVVEGAVLEEIAGALVFDEADAFERLQPGRQIVGEAAQILGRGALADHHDVTHAAELLAQHREVAHALERLGQEARHVGVERQARGEAKADKGEEEGDGEGARGVAKGPGGGTANGRVHLGHPSGFGHGDSGVGSAGRTRLRFRRRFCGGEAGTRQGGGRTALQEVALPGVGALSAFMALASAGFSSPKT